MKKLSKTAGTPNVHVSHRRVPDGVSLNHDGTDGTDGSDGTGIQSVSPAPSASVAGPSVSNSRSN